MVIMVVREEDVVDLCGPESCFYEFVRGGRAAIEHEEFVIYL